MSPASHSGTLKHTRGNGRHTGPGGGRTRGAQAVEVTQEMVEEERARLVQERQGEVQRVLDKHDDLVRDFEFFLSYVLMCTRYGRGFI